MTKDCYTLLDPRPTAKEAPYTFFLPSAEELAALRPGDRVYLDFKATPARTKWESERMWVDITAADGDNLRGALAHEPDDIPGLSQGAIIDFERWHALQVQFVDPSFAERFSEGPREYWERCLVDEKVLQGELQVGYIYREAPGMGEADDPYPDSGWRIRGDLRDASDAEIAGRNALYVALGAVLNCDDSWLALIDEPVGSEFEREFESGDWSPRPAGRTH